jgi:hypothetical protein
MLLGYGCLSTSHWRTYERVRNNVSGIYNWFLAKCFAGVVYHVCIQ